MAATLSRYKRDLPAVTMPAIVIMVMVVTTIADVDGNKPRVWIEQVHAAIRCILEVEHAIHRPGNRIE